MKKHKSMVIKDRNNFTRAAWFKFNSIDELVLILTLADNRLLQLLNSHRSTYAVWIFYRYGHGRKDPHSS